MSACGVAPNMSWDSFQHCVAWLLSGMVWVLTTHVIRHSIYEMIGAATNAGQSAAPKAAKQPSEPEVVTAEVVEDDSDPWKK